LLLASEAIALAPRVDGVVAWCAPTPNSRPALRMRDTLRQVKAEHIGVVLNAVRAPWRRVLSKEYQDVFSIRTVIDRRLHQSSSKRRTNVRRFFFFARI